MFPAILNRPARWLMGRMLRKLPSQLPCPACGAPVPRPEVTEDLWDTLVLCPHCGEGRSMLAWGHRSSHVGPPHVPATVLPQDTLVRIERSPEQQRWVIPAKGGCNFLMVFGALWLGITAVVLQAKFEFHPGDSMGPIGIGFMKGAFALVGGLTFLFGLRMAFLKHELEIADEVLHYRRQFLGRTKHLAWPLPTVQSVELKEFYQQNYQPVHGIEIRGTLGKIRFGSQLSLPEKEALVSQLKQSLLPVNPPSTAPAAVAVAKEDRASLPGRSLPEVDPRTGGVRIDTPEKWHPILLVSGIFFLTVASIMLWGGLGMLHAGAPWFFQAFGLFWCLGPAMGALIGLGLLYTAWKLKSTDRLIEVTPTSVRYSEGTSRQTALTTWEAREVRRAIVVETGTTNGVPNWRGEILFDARVLPFGWNRPKEELQQLAAAINGLLGKS